MEEISNRFDNLRVPVSANEREKGTTPYYGANGIQDYVKGFTHNGEYVLIAEDGANDLKNYPVKYVNGLFWANNHVHVVQGKEGICDNKYLKYCFTKTNIESLLVGGGRAKLNANIMMSINLTVPSFNEQVELGRMFYELDNLITLHQRKFNDILVYKLSTKFLFLKLAKNVWEQRKLSECTTFRRGSFPQPYGKVEWYDGNESMPFVQVADVGNDMKLVNETKQRISKVAQPMSVFIPKKSVIVTLQGTIGRVAITQYDAYLDRTVLYFDSYKNPINKNFWAYIIKNKFLEEAKSAPGGTIKTITKEVLSNFDLRIPIEVEEQNKIGECFNQIDNLITLHQHKELKRRNDNNEHLRW